MDDTLDRLEQLLNLMAKPDEIEMDRLMCLTGEWEGVVQLLLLESRVRSHLAEDKVRWRVRLEGLLARLPEIHAGLVAYQSEVAAQLYAENRRVQSLQKARDGLYRRQEPLVRCQA
ncbi:MAG: hypothetical protein H7833_21335 [Magnetococcus sp. DMHC-1]|nr:hypothetical protein [Magnetococcales bacterium]MBF0321816.1 hypothetical protein [Magnetococcales bacterium]